MLSAQRFSIVLLFLLSIPFVVSCGDESSYKQQNLVQPESDDSLGESLTRSQEPPEIPRTPLEAAMLYWRKEAKLCQGHPSKDNCDDGDATLFNGLLCASGEQSGCTAVAAAQGSDGRWWRSPRRVGNNAGQSNSFSRDMALGVLLYLQATGDETRAKSWLRWIKDNRPCSIKNPITGGCSVWGASRVCRDDSDNRCTLTPNMWSMFYYVWKHKGWGRNSDMNTHSGAYDSFAEKEVEQADLGYELHLKSVQTFLLLRSEPQHSVARKVLGKLVKRQPENPFFQWMSQGAHANWESYILSLCPSQSRPSRRYHQWSWERDTAEKAWQDSMGWDCLFLGKLGKSPALTGAEVLVSN